MSDPRRARQIAIGVGFAAGLIGVATIGAEAKSALPGTGIAKIASARVAQVYKRGTDVVSQQTYRTASCQGAWCGRQVVLMLGIGF